MSQGKIDLKPLVTHRYDSFHLTTVARKAYIGMTRRFKFDDAIEAFETTKAGKSKDGKGVIKAVISGPDVSPDDF